MEMVWRQKKEEKVVSANAMPLVIVKRTFRAHTMSEYNPEKGMICRVSIKVVY